MSSSSVVLPGSAATIIRAQRCVYWAHFVASSDNVASEALIVVSELAVKIVGVPSGGLVALNGADLTISVVSYCALLVKYRSMAVSDPGSPLDSVTTRSNVIVTSVFGVKELPLGLAIVNDVAARARKEYNTWRLISY